VGFYSPGEKRLKKIPVVGGSPTTLCEVAAAHNAAWGPDNTIVFDTDTALMRVSENGGTPEPIFDLKNEDVWDPRILPNKKTILFTISTESGMQIAVQSLASGERKILFPGQNAIYLATGHLVYAIGTTLYALEFNLDRLEAKGKPVPMVEGVLVLGAANYAISDSGSLAYLVGNYTLGFSSFVWVNRQGKEAPIAPEVKSYNGARLSPDETRVALQILDQSNAKWDIYIFDFASKSLSRFSHISGINLDPVWTPDGKRLAFSNIKDFGANEK
jgi:hypothetical protein